MYAAKLGSTNYTFQVSGKLWRDALIMLDMETKSLWSHITGEAIEGKAENQVLNLFPSSVSTFSEFKKLYPNGKLLSKEEKGEPGSRYKNYFAAEDKLGMFGRVDNFNQIPSKDKVVGVRIDNKQASVTESYLDENIFAVLTKLGSPVIVTKDTISNSVSAFVLESITDSDVAELKISVEDNIISFHGKKWDAQTGQSLDSKIESLRRVPLTVAFWFAWASFFPETSLIK